MTPRRSGESGNTIVITSALMLALTVLAMGTLRILNLQTQHAYERKQSRYGVLQAQAAAEMGVNYALWESQGLDKLWDKDIAPPDGISPGHQPDSPPFANYKLCYTTPKGFDIDTPTGDAHEQTNHVTGGAKTSVYFNKAAFALMKNPAPAADAYLMASASVELMGTDLGSWTQVSRSIRFALDRGLTSNGVCDHDHEPIEVHVAPPPPPVQHNWYQWYTLEAGSLADAPP